MQKSERKIGPSPNPYSSNFESQKSKNFRMNSRTGSRSFLRLRSNDDLSKSQSNYPAQNLLYHSKEVPEQALSMNLLERKINDMVNMKMKNT